MGYILRPKHHNLLAVWSLLQGILLCISGPGDMSVRYNFSWLPVLIFQALSKFIIVYIFVMLFYYCLSPSLDLKYPKSRVCMTSYFVPSASSSAWHPEGICDGFTCLHVILFFFLPLRSVLYLPPKAVLRGNKPSLSS